MKINNIKSLALAVLAVGAMASCSDDINIGNVDEKQYTTAENNKTLVFLTNKYGCSNIDSLMFNENGSTDFYVNVTKPASSEQSYTVSYDLAALERYNKANGTDFKALPENLVTISGPAVVAAGESQSAPVSIGFSTADELEMNGIYAIPLTVKSGAGAETSVEKATLSTWCATLQRCLTVIRELDRLLSAARRLMMPTLCTTCAID